MSYTDFTMKSNSAVWKHFLRDEKGQTAMCKLLDCKNILKFSGGLTKGPHIHMQPLQSLPEQAQR